MDQHVLTFAPTVERDGDGLPKRFAGIAYSGGVIPQYGPFGDAAIDLATIEIPDKALFALVDHDHTKRAGKFRAQVVDGQLRIAGEFFSSTKAGQEVAGLFAEGAPWELSVGIYSQAEVAAAPVERELNGQRLTAQSVFRHARLGEVSFVPIGADPATRAVAFSQPPAGAAPVSQEEPPMTDELQALQSRVSELEAQIASERTRADAAESQLREHALQARAQAIATLAADCGKEFSDAERAAFAGFDDATFATLSATLRAMKPAAPVVPAHLFAEQAVAGKAPVSDDERAAKARKAIFNQVSGRAA